MSNFSLGNRESHYNPDEPRDWHGRGTTGGSSWRDNPPGDPSAAGRARTLLGHARVGAWQKGILSDVAWPTLAEAARFSINLMGHAGSSLPPIGYDNSISLETVPLNIHPTDASIVTYDLFRSAMLAIIEAWEVTWCAAYPTNIMDFWPPVGSGHHFRLAWMTYVSPRFAPLIRPPRGIEAQTVAGGGLLMVATRERFDVANTDHMAAARAINTAMAPLNALPWPPDP